MGRSSGATGKGEATRVADLLVAKAAEIVLVQGRDSSDNFWGGFAGTTGGFAAIWAGCLQVVVVFLGRLHPTRVYG